MTKEQCINNYIEWIFSQCIIEETYHQYYDFIFERKLLFRVTRASVHIRGNFAFHLHKIFPFVDKFSPYIRNNIHKNDLIIKWKEYICSEGTSV